MDEGKHLHYFSNLYYPFGMSDSRTGDKQKAAARMLEVGRKKGKPDTPGKGNFIGIWSDPIFQTGPK